MATYVQVDDVRSRVGGRIIDGSSNPDETEVGLMLDEAEDELVACLLAIGVSSISTPGQRIVRAWVASYIGGVVRVSHAASAGDGGNEDGRADITRWDDRKKDMMERPTFYAQMFSAGAAPDSSINFQSWVTDNTDSLTVADGDFDPGIPRDEVF